VLTGIYQQDSDQRIKRRVVSAVAMNDDRKGAVKFLLGVAGNDADPEAKRGAMAQLSRLAIRRDGQPMDRLDPETQVQREAVVAIARRPKEESVPLLINIARTHPKEEVRRQAMLLLGRISDDRVLVFFTQELTK
jgi:HEAT repeat protein